MRNHGWLQKSGFANYVLLLLMPIKINARLNVFAAAYYQEKKVARKALWKVVLLE